MKNQIILCLIFFIVGCKTVSQSPDPLLKSLKSRNKILYTEEKNGYGVLILYDIKSDEKKVLISDFSVGTYPRMTSDGKYLVYFASAVSVLPFKPAFKLYNMTTKKEIILDLTSRLPKKDKVLDGLLSFELMGDSSVIFCYKDNLYSYNFLSDSVKLLKRLYDKKVWFMSVNNEKQKIAFGYQTGLSNLWAQEFGIYDLTNDTVIYHKYPLGELSNWSSDGSKLIFHDYSRGFYEYDISKDSIRSFNDSWGLKDIKFFSTRFLTDSQLLLLQSDKNNLFIFDTKKNKIIKQLTDDDLFRTFTDLSIVN